MTAQLMIFGYTTPHLTTTHHTKIRLMITVLMTTSRMTSCAMTETSSGERYHRLWLMLGVDTL